MQRFALGFIYARITVGMASNQLKVYMLLALF